MALVHEKLYQSADLAHTELGAYIRNVMKELFLAHGEVSSKVSLRLELEPVFLPVDMAIPCGLILNELATNSLKHAFVGRDRGTIDIHLTSVRNESVRLLFRDDGWGLPAGLDLQAAESLGLRLIRMLSKQLHGEVMTHTGEGTTFELQFRLPDSRGVGAAPEAKAVLDAQGEHSHR
jgi:two-component sensor histidine kinase